MTVWKFVFALLREMILGKQTWQQAFRENKLRLAFLGIVICSFYLNYLVLPKMHKAVEAQIVLEKSHREQMEIMQKQLSECRSKSSHIQEEDQHTAELLNWCLAKLRNPKNDNSNAK